jgi:hypothetical protein
MRLSMEELNESDRAVEERVKGTVWRDLRGSSIGAQTVGCLLRITHEIFFWNLCQHYYTV